MNPMEHKQVCELLQKTGWSASAIQRLCKFRDKYVQTPLDFAVEDHRRLEFVRWLVATGRLTDQAA